MVGPESVCQVSIPSYQGAIPLHAPETLPLPLVKVRPDELRERLRHCATVAERLLIVQNDPAYQAALDRHGALEAFLYDATPDRQYVLGLMAVLDPALFDGLEFLQDPRASLDSLASTLVDLEAFYQPIGGVLGYYATVVDLMSGVVKQEEVHQYLQPPFIDLQTPNLQMWKEAYEGIFHLGKTATILTLGGAGDRLNLIDERTGEPLPVARLMFCGRSLFEGLMRDIEALEYWHYRAFGRQVTVPILIMTSKEKQNDQHIEAMGREANWFGHPHHAIRRMIQPLVPVIDTDGHMAVTGPLQLAMKPGGHGVVWKLAKDSGALDWLMRQGVDNAIVRQVHNPLAGLDQNLALLAGYGRAKKKTFGFLSCPSFPGLAEGMNVLDVHRDGADTVGAITNIEYTQFALLKTVGVRDGCPANANILFIDLHAIDGSLAKNPIPGMIVNAKTRVDVVKDGQVTSKNGARLESCMQNIADGLASKIVPEAVLSPDDLGTFLLSQDRKLVKSEIKSASQPGCAQRTTPASGLYDWNMAMRQLFSSCSIRLPQAQSFEEFLRDGPCVLLAVHPAMGPFWEVIRQKVSGGTFAKGSEVELEVAELSCTELDVQGSFRIIADVVTGPMSGAEGRVFTDKVGRAKLNRLTVINKGVNSREVEAVLRGTLERKECCEMRLEGFSEVVAENVTIQGDFRLVVPDGQRAILTQGPDGAVVVRFEAITSPSWTYDVQWPHGSMPQLTKNDTTKESFAKL